MRSPRGLPAGLLDVGAASLATFLVGLGAARAFSGSPALLGAYALFFSAFLAAALVPASLVHQAGELCALALPQDRRLGRLDHTLRLGALPSVLSGATGAGIALLVSDGPWSVRLPLAGTSLLAVIISPAQDHVRRSLHAAGRSWQAAQVSLVQLGGVALALAVFAATRVPAGWVPFGALAAANTCSFAVALNRSRHGRAVPVLPLPSRRELRGTGRYLAVQGTAPAVAGFVASTVVAALAGQDALGFAEAARVAARPVAVLTAGLAATLGPRCVAAARAGRVAEAAAATRLSTLLTVVGGSCYAAVVAVPWIGNPFARLLPVAYVVPGLVLAAVGALIVTGLEVPLRSRLLGHGRERWLAGTEAGTNLLQPVGATAAALIGASARPLASALKGVVLTLVLAREVRAADRRAATSPDLEPIRP